MTAEKHMQMSDTFTLAVFIVLSGGLQDAYTYFCRDGVFANAQTGNVVLMSTRFFEGDFSACFRYLVPVAAFFCGIITSELIRKNLRDTLHFHWRQVVLLFEILLLALVGLVPQSANSLANALVSFSCAMQVQAFRTVHGYAYASTMCIGNLRSEAEAFCTFFRKRELTALHRGITYFAVIAIFGAGAGVGALLTARFAEKTIWCCCLLLTVAFILMFRKEK